MLERQFEEALLELERRKFRIGNVCSFIEKQRLFLSVFVDDIKIAGRQQNMAPMWKKLMKLVDLGEPTSFLGHVYLGCTQRECKPNETINENLRRCSSHVFLLEQQKNYRCGKSLTHKQSRDPSTWRDMLKNALSDVATWQRRRWSNCTKFRALAWIIIHSSRKT